MKTFVAISLIVFTIYTLSINAYNCGELYGQEKQYSFFNFVMSPRISVNGFIEPNIEDYSQLKSYRGGLFYPYSTDIGVEPTGTLFDLILLPIVLMATTLMFVYPIILIGLAIYLLRKQ